MKSIKTGLPLCLLALCLAWSGCAEGGGSGGAESTPVDTPAITDTDRKSVV